MENKGKRIMLLSDVHRCHADWYGVDNAARLQKMVDDLQAEYQRAPYEAILFLGDYSLDHWEHHIKGCYINDGKSYTRTFVETCCPQLPAPWYMIAGNHEQYGEDKWREITGCSRQGVWVVDDWLFILLDTFAGNLDPTEHSDGTSTPMDVAFIRAQMDAYPEHKVVLCAHHFDFDQESDEARALVRDERIVCLFSGHVHLSRVNTLPPELGGKKHIWTGQYSYSSAKPVTESMWGYREVWLYDDRLETRYITPANTIVIDGETITVPYGVQDEAVIPLK